MSKDLVALRVGTGRWMTEAGLAGLLDYLDQHPGVVDEVVFFTSFTHPPLPLDEMERRCARLAQVLPQVRAAGYRVGINVLASMGHHEENLPHSLAAPWPRVTDAQGRICLGSFCPAGAELLDYVRRIYTLVAQTGPDFIWIDDDVRLFGHMPVGATCFCEGCVARFNRAHGTDFTRESLVSAMSGEPTVARDLWRDRWLEHNRQIIATLLRTAAEAAHCVNPRLEMGFMTGDRFYEGYAFAEWAEALEGSESGPPRWRPGGGFYSDDAYMGLVEKAHDVGRQASQLPRRVTVIQSEIENFPYQRLRKSVAITMLEATAHMAAGATGLAFNIIGNEDPLDEYRPFLDAIATHRLFWEALRSATGREPAIGVWPAWSRAIYADHGASGDWLTGNASLTALRRLYVLAELGLPIAYAAEGCRVCLLSGPLPAAFDQATLERCFAGGVLLDVAALRSLERMGLAHWAGVCVGEEHPHDMSEVLSSHPLNGRFVGWSRDCRQSFWPEMAYRLEPLAEGVEELAHLRDYAGVDHGACLTAYRNTLGGRVVVAGYYPWTLVHNLAKSSQLKSICQWLSGEQLPAVVETFARTVLWARYDAQRRLAVVLLNASLDAVPELVLRACCQGRWVRCLSMDGREAELEAEADGSQHVRLTLRNVLPWNAYLLTWRE